MLIGQSLVCDLDTESTVIPTVAYSPWFSRQGNGATFFSETIALKSANVKLDIVIQHKTKQETDSAAVTAGSFTTISSITTSSKAASDLKELVRFKYTISSTSTAEWVHFRMMPPAWEFDGA